MTEKEALNVLENVWDFAMPDDDEEGDILEEAIDVATQALEKLQIIKEYLEPLRNYNTQNEHLERLKELTR